MQIYTTVLNMNIREKEYKLGELLGYRCIKIEYGSCGGMVFEHIWVKGEHTLQTADWYCWSYTGIPFYGRDYNSLLDAEREAGIGRAPVSKDEYQRQSQWRKYWEEKEIAPEFAPQEARLDALIHVLEKFSLTTH